MNLLDVSRQLMTEASLNEITQKCPTSARLWPENLEQASTVAASHMARYTFAQKYADGKQAGLEIVKRHPGKNLIELQCLILFKKTQDL